MAGPLSSEEIEDVVSSVRRLVSNEQRVLTRDLNAERLVLTSAYRVVPETSPLSPLMLDAPLVEASAQPLADVVEDVSSPEGADALTGSLEDSLAQALAVDDEPELTGEGNVSANTSRPAATMTDTVEGEWEDEIWAEPGQISLGEVALAAEEAEVLTAPEPEVEHIEDATIAAAAAAPLDEGNGAWGDEPIPFVHLRRRAEDLAARLAAGGVVEQPATTDAPESDADPDASVPDPMPATGTMPPAGDTPQMATDLYDADGTPLAVLDETALNEIVRQVLRAELQGELGERITRNVRKLVRAEINRALLARDLD